GSVPASTQLCLNASSANMPSTVTRCSACGVWSPPSATSWSTRMRPILPALAALAWGEPRRRSYWEQELLNALVIVERGWGNPGDMIGSGGGACGSSPTGPEGGGDSGARVTQ